MPADLSKLFAKLPKELKDAVRIVRMEDVVDPYGDRLPFGIMSLDRALKGGIPGGTVVQVFGPDGIGKDYLSQLAIASAQQKYGDACNIFYVTFGYYPDREFMRFSGAKIPRSDLELELQGIDPEEATPEQRGERVGNCFFVDIDKAGKDKPAEYMMATALHLIESAKFQLCVINEMASGETESGAKKEPYEKERVAAWPTLMSVFCRKLYATLRSTKDEDGRPNSTRVLLLTPVRENIDQFSYEKYSQPGGRAQKHAKVVDIHLDAKGKLKKGNEFVGKTVKWRIAKGKLGIHEGAEGEWDFMFADGVDRVDDLVRVAIAVGTITRSGPVYHVLDDERSITGGWKIGVADVLRADPELCARLEAATLEAVKREKNATPVEEAEGSTEGSSENLEE